jgi:DNA gyrase subunit B
LKKYTSKLTGKYVVSRFKGLGEMDSDQLWETTMDPKRRNIKRVELNDLVEADQITTILMGTKVPPRKEFIQNYYHMADITV